MTTTAHAPATWPPYEHAPPLAILEGDARTRLREVPDGTAHCVITSIPFYGLRFYDTTPQVWGGRQDCQHDWRARPGIKKSRGTGKSGLAGWDNGLTSTTLAAKVSVNTVTAPESHTCKRCRAWRGELGLEPAPEMFVDHVVEVFREVRRVLRDDGVLWLNVGDSYAGSWGTEGRKGPDRRSKSRAQQQAAPRRSPTKHPTSGLKAKDLMGIPWRVALALQADGWWLRSDVIWAKANPMPESVEDRPTKGHEYVFLFAKSEDYLYDTDGYRTPAGHHLRRDKRDPDAAPRLERGQNGTAGRGAHPLGSVDRGANLRTVWEIKTAPSFWEYCLACSTWYDGANLKHIRTRILTANGTERAVPDDWWQRDAGEKRDELAEDEREVRECATCKATDAWVDHFAVFPPALVERCLLTGTSAHGACRTCGAPWRRRVARGPARKVRNGPAQTGQKAGEVHDLGESSVFRTGLVPARATAGWDPSCDCADNAPVPCVVLDPFLGSGTTALVALNHGRHAIGVELNPRYAALARKRIEKKAPAATARRLDAFLGDST